MQNINRTYERPPVDQLTPVEQKIWDLMQQGKTRNEIAEATNMKPQSTARRILVINEKVQAQRD